MNYCQVKLVGFFPFHQMQLLKLDLRLSWNVTVFGEILQIYTSNRLLYTMIVNGTFYWISVGWITA